MQDWYKIHGWVKGLKNQNSGGKEGIKITKNLVASGHLPATNTHDASLKMCSKLSVSKPKIGS